MSDQESISADELEGLATMRDNVEARIRTAAEDHDHLDADALEVVTMYVVGSIGAGQGRKGSDLDLVVQLDYTGETTGPYDWQEYVQSDIEDVLKRNRTTLAEPLPSYVGYIDPTLGNRFDCEAFIENMLRHGEYDRIYDMRDEAFMSADHFRV